MKIKYLATFAAVSLLTIGVATAFPSLSAATPNMTKVAACAGKENPCAGKENPCAGKVNPCASKPNPCAAKENPCAAKVDPCAGKENPCAAKVNPCASKPNPCAAKENPCAAKANLQQYAGQVHFWILDASDKSSTAKSEAIASELGLGDFFAANKIQTVTLTIVEPSTGKILAQHCNNASKAAYTKVLDTAIAKKQMHRLSISSNCSAKIST